ncbi:MAG: tetratricopeptide repeat protein [Desulfobulbia bacterium]
MEKPNPSSLVRGMMDKAIRLAQKSLELDQSNPFAHWTLGRVTKGDTLAHIETAIRSIEKAIELQPNYADAFAYLTYLYTGSGRLTDSSAAIKNAMELNPIYPYWYLHARGVVDYMTDNFDGAVVNFEAAIARNPAVHFIQFLACGGLRNVGSHG